MINMQMLDRLNERLPVERRFAQLRRGPLKRIRFMKRIRPRIPKRPYEEAGALARDGNVRLPGR